MSKWQGQSGSQVTCQIELFAFVLMRMHHEAVFHNRAVIAFLDNEAARFCLIKGSSPSRSMFALADLVSRIEARCPSGFWFERVSTHSNVADLPSRGKLREAADIVGGDVKGDISIPGELMQAVLSSDNW